ncbi:oxidoreductase [Pseudomonas sp. TTU2014-080ASC]|uniref:oxidoreductase n=1 Tax=Pseudomonas sp. TTU2014-080ASC TaxID=1729724 RepID=UPI0007189221|nr:oxidoreductase [Pseudomonas sp. TTU2014-080ASC]KRW58476.1 oxidoreductase [Pseudomonas sp. TTU2014-080ASC]
MFSRMKTGLIGYGYAGKTFHAPLISMVADLELTAIASSNEARVREDFSEVSTEPSAAALLARDDLELIVIATPNDTHFDLAAQALTAGKHVVVDKPFTVTVAEAKELISLADQYQRLLSVFHNRRWDADFVTLKTLLDSGELGRVVHVESRFDRFRPQVRSRWRETAVAGGGLWYDLGPHLLDQAVQLFGLPQSIWLDQEKLRDGAVTDDWFHAVLGYAQLRVVLHASALAASPAPRFSVHGTHGSFIKFGLDVQEDALRAGLGPEDTDWGRDPQQGRLTLWDGDTVHECLLPGEVGNYRSYYSAIFDAIRHGGDNPVPAQQALQVMQLIEAGCTSCLEGRTVELALPG